MNRPNQTEELLLAIRLPADHEVSWHFLSKIIIEKGLTPPEYRGDHRKKVGDLSNRFRSWSQTKNLTATRTFKNVNYFLWKTVLQAVPGGDELLRRPRKHALILVSCLSVLSLMVIAGWWLQSRPDPVPRQIADRVAAGDRQGLRALDVQTKQRRPAATDKKRAEIAAELEARFGLAPGRLSYEPATYTLFPYRTQIARAAGAMDHQVVRLEADKVVALLAYLDQPMCLVSGPDGFLPVHIGDRVHFKGSAGPVLQISNSGLDFEREDGGLIQVRPAELELLPMWKKPGPKSVIWAREKGNLRQLLALIGAETGRRVQDRSRNNGQVVGYFPPVTRLEALLECLAPLGVRFDQESIVLEQEPEVKLLLGWYGTEAIRPMDSAAFCRFFNDVLPLPLEPYNWGQETYWYSGQSFEEVLDVLAVKAFVEDGQIRLVK